MTLGFILKKPFKYEQGVLAELPLQGYIPVIIKSLIFLQEIGHDGGGQEESTADSGAEKSVIHPESMVSPMREKVC